MELKCTVPFIILSDLPALKVFFLSFLEHFIFFLPPAYKSTRSQDRIYNSLIFFILVSAFSFSALLAVLLGDYQNYHFPTVNSLTFSGCDSDPMLMADDRDGAELESDRYGNIPTDYGFMLTLLEILGDLPQGTRLVFFLSFLTIFYVFLYAPAPIFSWQAFVQGYIGFPDAMEHIGPYTRRKVYYKRPDRIRALYLRHYREIRRRRKREYLLLRWIATLPPAEQRKELRKEINRRNWSW